MNISHAITPISIPGNNFEDISVIVETEGRALLS